MNSVKFLSSLEQLGKLEQLKETLQLFVLKFDDPCLIVSKDGTNYGKWYGAQFFENGSYALADADAVTLYDAYGNMSDDGFNDCFVFADGKRLVQKQAGGDWQLFEGNKLLGDKVCYLLRFNVKPFEDVFAVGVEHPKWGVAWYFAALGQAGLLNADDAFFAFEVNNELIDVERADGMHIVYGLEKTPECQRLNAVLQTECPVLYQQDFLIVYTPSPSGQFASRFNVYSRKGELKYEQIRRVVALVNGMYLIKFEDGWNMYNSNGSLFRKSLSSVCFEQNLTGMDSPLCLDKYANCTSNALVKTHYGVVKGMPDLLVEICHDDKLLEIRNIYLADGTPVIENVRECKVRIF